MNTGQLRKAMALIRKNLNPEVTVSQIECFFIVAENEGIKEQEIAQQINISKPTLRRDIARLADQAKGGGILAQAGHAVCDVKDDGSVFLTEKGKQLIKDILK